MNEERERRINNIFGRALELAPAEREDFLGRACASATREEVLGLLRAHDQMGGFLESPAAERLDLAVSLEVGAEIGSYRIVKRLGAGGGGTVYEAEQRSPRRRVALKVRHAALGSSSAQHRFREEAEILARLDHPDVAHVYEAGVHEGLPWFAMEFVAAARNVMEHARALDLRARLRLFARICDAVHHGHQKGIVHRDLKPGNILVRPDGQPKIIDFGIAHAEGMASADGDVVGTPAYMSPEQCTPGGPEVDVRSDVYSLGVVLHEMAGGRLPHDVSGLSVGEATRRVRGDPPQPPPHSLPPDLRAILGRALERDRDRRYASAAYLAEEVRRFLAYEPVVAARGSRFHHARLFVRRNPALVASIAALVVVLATGVAVSSVFAYRATEARDREREEADIARLAAAHAALRVYDVREARRLLSLVTPAMRHWEWHYLASRLDRARHTYRDPGLRDAVAAPRGGDGRLVVAGIRPDLETTALLVFGEGDAMPVERRVVDGLVSTRIARDRDGRRLAWGTDDGSIVVLDAFSLEIVATARAFPEPAEVRSVAFSPDGRCVLSAGRKRGVTLVEIATGEVLATIDRTANEALFSPDGTLIALATKDNEVEIWDATGMVPLETLKGHGSRVTSILFDPGAERLVTASTDGTVRVWDLRGDGETATMNEPRGEPIHCADLSPDGTLLMTGHQDGTVTLWDVRERQRLDTYWGHDSWIKSVCFAADGGVAWTAAVDGAVKEWRLRGEDPGRFGRFPRLVRDIEYSRDGRRLACAVFDRTVRVLDLSRGGAETVLDGHADIVQAVAFRPDGRILASVSADGDVRVWEAEEGRLVHSFAGGERANLAISFSPDGQRLVTGGRSGAATWDAGTFERLLDLPATNWCWTASFAPDGRSVVATGADGRLRVWDARSGAPIREVRATEGEISCAAFTADGRTLVTGGGRSIDLWDVRDWHIRATHELPVDYVQGVAPSPDGTRIAVGSWGSVRLVDAVTGRTTIELRDHRAIVWDVAFHPDGTQFASAAGGYEGQGCEVRLWGRLPGAAWPPSLEPASR